ncbi:MAG: hypothetical protein RIS88_1788 [Pseudomonadota bacterium]|jgi:hypothetical protein
MQRLLLLGIFSLLAAGAQAGTSCEVRQPGARAIMQGMSLAQATQDALEADYRRSGTQVVILARAGQDLSRYNLKYSHLGFVYRTPQGPWRVVHKLNQCGTAEADIYREGLAEFFLDDLSRYEAAWVVPVPSVQAQLLPLLQNNRRAVTLQHSPYSMVSYAWSQRYQQSNQWAIETLALAVEPAITSREKAQAWLRLKAYEPSTLNLTALTRLGARMTKANVAFDDHPNEKRYSDRIDTVTVDSVFAWLVRANLSGPVVRLELPAPDMR